MIDAAELARDYLAANAAESGADVVIQALIGELEKARWERDAYHVRWLPLCLERDAAYALLREAHPWLGGSNLHPHVIDIRARISALIGDAK